MTRLSLVLLASCGAATATATDHTTTATARRPRMTRVATKAPAVDHLECGDTVLNDQLTTGGIGPVTTWQPCFDVTEEQAVREQTLGNEAPPQRSQAEIHAAAQLVQAEAEACRDVPAHERDHSVFAHKKAIASVEPVRDATGIRGVRVTFKPVRGLTKAFIERDIACTRARWAVSGRDPKLMPYDPTLVDGADVHVVDDGGRTVVTVTAGSADAAQVLLARAQGQLTAEM